MANTSNAANSREDDTGSAVERQRVNAHRVGPEGGSVIRPFAAVIVLVVAGCGPTQSAPPSSAPATTVASAPATIVSPTPSAVASAAADPDLAWAPLTGLDLRGATVAKGAGSGSTTLLIGADTKSGALISWTSADGSHWERHWLDGSTFGGGLPQGLVAGGPGFVALGWDPTGAPRTDAVVWSSSNGVDWAEDPDPSGHFDGTLTTVAATSSAVVATVCCTASGASSLRTSSDGIVWQVSTPPGADETGSVRAAAAGDAFLALSNVDEGPVNGKTVLVAWRSRDGRTWTRDDAIVGRVAGLGYVTDVIEAGDGFTLLNASGNVHVIADDGSISTVGPPVSYASPIPGPAGLLWLGATDSEVGACFETWVDRADRTQISQPADSACATTTDRPDGVIPVPDGWLAISAKTATSDTTVWALRPVASVTAVAAPDGPMSVPPTSALPVLPTGPLSASVPCPADPISIGEVIGLDLFNRAACFGSRQLRFRAWVVDPGEGYGGACMEVVTAWLQPCVLPDWWLAPDRTGTVRLDAVRRPGAVGDLKGVGRWVNVTGHFDDPAAATCRSAAGPTVIGEPPVGWSVLHCREQFAVTQIETTR
jgi:hypothetical protein